MKSNVSWFASGLLALILLAVQMLREWIPIGSEPYLLLRLSSSSSFLGSLYDAYSFGGRLAADNYGTAVILNIIGSVHEVILILLPAILGVGAFVLLLHIFRGLGVQDEFTGLILAISPSFIFVFGSLNQYFMPFFFAVLAFYLFMRNGLLRYAAVVPALALPFLNFHIALLFIMLAGLYAIWKEKGKKAAFVLVPAAAVLAVWWGFMVLKAGAVNLQIGQVSVGDGLRILISDFGNPAGIGLFALIAMLFGIARYWKRKYENVFVFVGFVLLLVYSLFRVEGLIMLNLFAAYFACLGLQGLCNWENLSLRNFTLLIFVCGLLFSGLVGVNMLVHAEPDGRILDGLEFLEAEKEGVVFSHYSRGNWIAFAGRQNVMDENMLFIKDLKERMNDSENLFYTRELQEASMLIDKYGIKYIWIDEGMKKKVWKDNEEGLLFLLKYSRMFNRIYNEGDVEVWRVERE
ncbi:hypothetical protein HZB88_01220 [archaeon]|nr:hypothetical protein [archaeon]